MEEFTERLGNSFNWFAEGDALEYKVLKQTPAAFELNVTRCRYAEFYQALGAPELGFLLTCDADSSFAEGFGPDVELTRTKTIMQGFDHCDFRSRSSGCRVRKVRPNPSLHLTCYGWLRQPPERVNSNVRRQGPIWLAAMFSLAKIAAPVLVVSLVAYHTTVRPTSPYGGQPRPCYGTIPAYAEHCNSTEG